MSKLAKTIINMKIINLAISLLIVIAFGTCKPQTTTPEPVSFESLEGTWRLVHYKVEGDTTWKSYPDNVLYQKHITPTHFYWESYDLDKDSLVGAGGGTYIYDKDAKTYTEDINFFLPAGSNELGQTIPFEVGNDDGKWFHKGYAQVYEFDPETGNNVVVDSSLIEEIWEHTAAPSSKSTFVGTWELISYRQTGDSLYTEYPDFVKYIKLITPTHFAWVQFNSEADEVMGAGGGTYQLSNAGYVETVLFFYPRSDIRGQTITFTDDVDQEGIWHLAGTVKDGGKIDEFWRRHESHGPGI